MGKKATIFFDHVRFRKAVEAYGTQEKLAEAAEISLSTINTWCNGRQPNPRINDLIRACVEMNISVAYVIHEVDDDLAFKAIREFEKTVDQIDEKAFFADVDYSVANRMKMDEDKIKSVIERAHWRIKRLKLEEAVNTLQSTLIERRSKK